MFGLNIFTEAIASHETKRAADIGSALTETLKPVAREIWTRWVSSPVPF